MTKPVIGILLDSENGGSFSKRPYYALRKDYFTAVETAGGVAVGIGHGMDGDALMALVDGVLVPGGDYAFPPEWYVDGKESVYAPNDSRLIAESALVRRCLDEGKPMLAICCGMQVMAMVTGGKMTSCLPVEPMNHRPEVEPYKLRHEIAVAPGSLLGRIVGTQMAANTHHREGVVSIGEELVVSGRAEDGVVEALEKPGHPFALGVQWHPECSLEDAQNRALFEAFVAACRR